MIDLLFIKNRWKKCVLDVESRPTSALHSDHTLVISKLQIKLRRTEQTHKQEKVMRFETPDNKQQTNYNTSLIQPFEESAMQGEAPEDTKTDVTDSSHQ